MFNIKFLEGQHIYLRPLLEQDAEGNYPSWLNDTDVCQGNSHHVFPYSKKQACNYIEQANNTDKALILAVVLQEKDTHIGNIALQRINYISRSAELAILLGDKKEWGKGYGLEASKLLVHHGFTCLNLHRIECATYETNIGMQKLALALGMKQEGVKREAAYKNGKYLDIIEYAILREELK